MLGSWRRPRSYSINIHIQVESELTASSWCSKQAAYLATSEGARPAAEAKLLFPLLSTEEPTLRSCCQSGSLCHVETLRSAQQMVAKMDRSWGAQLWGEAKGDGLGQVKKDPLTTWRDSDNGDRITRCGDVRPHPKEPQPQIAGDVQVGHQEKNCFFGKWYRSGSGAWGGGGITVPGGVQDSAGQSLSWFDLVLATVLWVGRWMK